MIIDGNQRNRPIIELPEQKSQFYRVANLAIPFLHLYRPTSIAVTVLSGSLKFIEHASVSLDNYQKGREWKHLFYSTSQLILVSSVVALDIFYPKISLMISHAKKLTDDIYYTGLHIYNLEGIKAANGILRISHTIIHVVSIIQPTPSLLLISLCAQASLEFYSSLSEYQKNRKVEGIANFLLGLIRIYFAYPHACKVRRDLFGKQATDENLKLVMDEIRILKEKYPDREIDFDRVLSKHNISGCIRANPVSGQIPDSNYTVGSLSTLDLSQIEGVKFENLHFEGINIGNKTCKNVLFNRVTFVDVRFSL